MTTPETHISNSEFSLGEVRIAASAKRKISTEDVQSAIHRHSVADWGEVTPEEWVQNDANLKAGHRLLSAYRAASGYTFWIITDYDRGSTTVF